MSEPEAAVTFELRVDDEVYRSVAERCLDHVPAVWTQSRISALPRGNRSGITPPEVRIQAVDGGPVQVDLAVDLDDSVPIPAVASSLQQEVKTVIEEMTGVEVSRVDVMVRRLFSVREISPPPPAYYVKGHGENESEE